MNPDGLRRKAPFILLLTLTVVAVGFSARLLAHVSLGGTPPGLSEEYFTGGRMGTVFDTTSRCLELPSPAVAANPKLNQQFNDGELLFLADFVTDPKVPYGGLGPVYITNSCMNCHPNYGRGRRVDKFSTQFGNGYTVFVHTPDGKLVDGYMFMLQTKAVPPYKPPARDVKITWRNFVDQYGNRYPDGTRYNSGKPTEGTLIYPTAELVDPLLPLPAGYKVSLESTIGFYGSGLLDAIPDEDIIAESKRQQAMPGSVKGRPGAWIVEPHDGKKHLGKFTYHNTRATLQNGPGLNGMWNVFNLTRTDRPRLFASSQWIAKQRELGLDTAPLVGSQPHELAQKDVDDLMVWSRGLAVPAARNLHKPEVQRGRELFQMMGCVQCHKPSWVTGDYPYIPAYGKQKIWPYTDMLTHDLGTMNHGVSRFFRTPPLWARGLSRNAADHTDLFHDRRARDFEEAILWHFGEANFAREMFRHLSADKRKDVIRFLESI